MARPYTCPKCKSVRTHRKGYRRTTCVGFGVLRKCNDCGYRFTVKKRLDPSKLPTRK